MLCCWLAQVLGVWRTLRESLPKILHMCLMMASTVIMTFAWLLLEAGTPATWLCSHRLLWVLLLVFVCMPSASQPCSPLWVGLCVGGGAQQFGSLAECHPGG
jgi:hypothetical protein